ncbi:MAG TPA: hypothetical protein VJ810_26580 [Blastocatellia bacterium]|nr:hypothetical protein [Blastocatellia bacterium]
MKKFQPTLKLGFALAAAIALLITLSIWPAAQQSTEAALNGDPVAPAAIKVEVSFTIASRKKNCQSGLGLCDVKFGIGVANKAASSRQVKGFLSLEDDGKLSCEFSGKLPEPGSSLEIDQAIALSADIAKKLGVKSATIEAGTIPLSGNRALLKSRILR